jgi:hypothetical protein
MPELTTTPALSLHIALEPATYIALEPTASTADARAFLLVASPTDVRAFLAKASLRVLPGRRARPRRGRACLQRLRGRHQPAQADKLRSGWIPLAVDVALAGEAAALGGGRGWMRPAPLLPATNTIGELFHLRVVTEGERVGERGPAA